MNYRDYTEADVEAAREQVEERATRYIERTEDRYEARLEKLYRELALMRGNRDALSEELNRLRLVTDADKRVLDAMVRLPIELLERSRSWPEGPLVNACLSELARRGEK